MRRGIIITAVIFAIVLAACKKSSPAKMYYYEEYNIGTKYPTNSTPADSFSFVDSLQTSYPDFRGDTINYGPDNRFFVSGPYYEKRYQHFEVYRYTK